MRRHVFRIVLKTRAASHIDCSIVSLILVIILTSFASRKCTLVPLWCQLVFVLRQCLGSAVSLLFPEDASGSRTLSLKLRGPLNTPVPFCRNNFRLGCSGALRCAPPPSVLFGDLPMPCVQHCSPNSLFVFRERFIDLFVSGLTCQSLRFRHLLVPPPSRDFCFCVF